jgi:cytochrome c-type biogenesis protein
MFTEAVSFPAAFTAGILSFLSPCVLPLIPAYFTFITGFSLEELTENRHSEIRKKVFFSTVSFVSGFSLIFILMGASASYLGSLMFNHRELIRIIGGILIILMGVHLTGIIRIPGLDVEKRIHMEKKPYWQGIVLLAVYSAGLALPFMIISVFIHLLLTVIKKASRVLKYVNAAAGILLIIAGLILVTNKLHVLIG